jgi:hypothetical protein
MNLKMRSMINAGVIKPTTDMKRTLLNQSINCPPTSTLHDSKIFLTSLLKNKMIRNGRTSEHTIISRSSENGVKHLHPNKGINNLLVHSSRQKSNSPVQHRSIENPKTSSRGEIRHHEAARNMAKSKLEDLRSRGSIHERVVQSVCDFRTKSSGDLQSIDESVH